MATEISFDQTRFRRAIDRARATAQTVAEKHVGFDCPSCGTRNRATVDQVARQSTVECAACHRSFQLVDKNGGFGRTLRGE